MNQLFEALRSKAEKFRATMFLGALDRSELVYVHSFRLLVEHSGAIEKYRAVIMVRAKNMSDADDTAAAKLKELGQCPPFASSEKPLEIKSIRSYPIARKGLNDESDTVLRLLSQMRRDATPIVSSIERFEDAFV